MTRKWIAVVTSLLLLSVALLPTASAQAATSATGANATYDWKQTFQTLVTPWNQPIVKYTIVLYSSNKQGKLIYSPIIQVPTTPIPTKKPVQTVTPSNPATPSQPATPPSTQPQTPTTPSGSGTTVTTPAGLTADEQRMVQLVNQERQKAGLQPLQVDMNLVKVARIKAQDMVNNGYFSHTSPTYGSPFDMMRAFGITNWRAAAENIAQNPSVDGAHNSFMNSAGHRNNILNPSFNKVGIGIVNGGPYGKTFVQLFIQSY